MKKYQHLILFISLLIIDVAWLSYYSNELFDKTSPLLFLFITTRIGLLIIARVLRKLSGNWLYLVFTAAYLLFSFAVASLYYVSSNSAAAY